MDKNWMNRARSRMRENKISQDQLARSLACTRGAISHYLSGRRIPNLDQLETIAACLGVQPAWLLYGIDAGAVHEHNASYKAGIPVAGNTETGPTAVRTGYLSLTFTSPHCYALLVSGTLYAPRMYEGEAILVDPGIEVQPGDDVVIRFKDEPGVALYTFVNSRGRQLIVNALMDNKQRRVIENDQLEFMHCIVAVVRTNSVILE